MAQGMTRTAWPVLAEVGTGDDGAARLAVLLALPLPALAAEPPVREADPKDAAQGGPDAGSEG